VARNAYNRIDLSRIVGLDLTGKQRRMQSIAQIFVSHWKAKARKKLNTTLPEYNRGIMIDDVNPEKITLTLRGMLPNLVERGMGPNGIGSYGPYDLRKYMLPHNGKHYRAIPFRHTLGSIGKRGGQEAVDAAKALAGHRQAYHGSGLPGRMTAGQTPPGTMLRLPAGMAPKIRSRPDVVGLDVGMPTVRPAHATDPLAGLMKITHDYSAGSGGRVRSDSYFITFRTMSLHGKPWISKGVKPRNIIKQVDFAKVVTMVFDAWRSS
jgi:hypothetical protein